MSRFLNAAGAVVDRIKINVLSKEVRDGRTVWVKRRHWMAKPIMMCANCFFELADNPVRTIDDLDAWQRWEVDCFLGLHEGYLAFATDDRAVAADEVPGKSLSAHLNEGTLTTAMLAAAGRELRRAHEWDSSEFAGPWSHGDPHAGNFVYDPSTDRARLIDFEVMHHKSLSPQERHADDLLVLLLDLVGRVRAADWVPNARAFLKGYGRTEIIQSLERMLIVPKGFARVWWAVRTTYLDPGELVQRIEALRENLPFRQR